MKCAAVGRALLFVATLHCVVLGSVAADAAPDDDEQCYAGMDDLSGKSAGRSCPSTARKPRRRGLLQIGHNLLPRVSESFEDPFASLEDEFDVSSRPPVAKDPRVQRQPVLPKESDRQFYVAMCQDLLIFIVLIGGVKVCRWTAAKHAAELQAALNVRYEADVQEIETAVVDVDAATATPSAVEGEASPGTDGDEASGGLGGGAIGESSEGVEADISQNLVEKTLANDGEVVNSHLDRAEPEPEEH